jgi:hypothetical protein
MLRGRRDECAVLDRLLDDARAGSSGVLVLCGEAGVGKTALLEYAVEAGSDLRMLRAAGVESEMELAFAALHQLCAPTLDRLERLPGPQREALGTAFGFSAGAVPDRFLVGLTVLSLSRKRRRSCRCCAWSTMRNGWTAPRRKRWSSWRAGFWRSRW